MRIQITNVTPKVMARRYVNLALLSLAAITLVGLEIEPLGWMILILGILSLKFCDYEYSKYSILLHLSVGALGLAPIGTNTDLPFAFYMGLGLLTAVSLPYIFTRFVYKTDVIQFPSLKEGGWTLKRFLYIFLTGFVCWLILPVILRSESIYLNWEMSPGFWSLLESYVGLNFVGIWDELFFVLTVLAILQRLFPFTVANAAQAILFTSFLYAVGFESWAFIPIYAFALLQGYIFKQTKSLLFILAIHLTVDLFLHLALVQLHFPDSLRLFVT